MQPKLDTGELTRLRMALSRLGRVLRQQSVDGLSYPQMSLLFAVERLEPVATGELAATEGVTPPAVTRSLNELDRLGFVVRVQDTADRRISLIGLTDAGRRECSRIRWSRDAWLTDRVKHLTPAEITVLITALPVLERLCDPASPSS